MRVSYKGITEHCQCSEEDSSSSSRSNSESISMKDLSKIWAKIQASLDDLTTVKLFGIEIETTNEKWKQYQDFVKENELPLEKLGTIGGEWTLSITPTSIGNIYIVKHVNGNEFDLTVYEAW